MNMNIRWCTSDKGALTLSGIEVQLSVSLDPNPAVQGLKITRNKQIFIYLLMKKIRQ